MPFSDLEREVLEPDLCARCGACAPACPHDAIRFQELLPVLVSEHQSSACGDCRACLEVCPGADPDTPGSETWLFGRVRTPDERWLGVMRATYGAASLDPVVFEASASGGASTTLLRCAAELYELDGVLVMGREQERPWRAAPVLCRDIERLHEYAQSTYQLAPFLEPLSRLFRDHPEQRIAMSATACHVQALRKLQRSDSELGELARKNVVFVLEIGCSSSTTPAGTESLIKEVLDVPLSRVTSLRYRDGEYPGQITVGTRDGEVHRVPFWQAVRHFAANKTHRCLSCGDWISGLSDVSVSDGDPNIFAASLGQNDISKHGRVFVRTERGQEVLEFAQRSGALKAWEIELSGLNLGLERKRNRRASYERSGKPVPVGPIPGFMEELAVVDDSRFLAVPSEATPVGVQPATPAESASVSRRTPLFARAGARTRRGSDYACPSDKSISQRALLLAVALPGTKLLRRMNLGGAVLPLLTALRQLGVRIEQQADGALRIDQWDGLPPGAPEPYLNLGPSSAAARMLLGLLVGRGVGAVIDGDATLRQRPMDWVVNPLRELGAELDYLSEQQLPIRIRPAALHDGGVTLSVGSAQAQAAVLFAAFGAGIKVRIEQQVTSRDHTVRMLRALGAEVSVDGAELSFVPPERYLPFSELEIPVDPSAVSYLVAAHLLTQRKDTLRVENVCLNPTRTGLFELLRRSGADIRYENVGERFGEPVGDVCVGSSRLLRPLRMDDAFTFHAMIDEVPLAAAIATQVPGVSEFLGAGELTFKETNRLLTTRDMLRAFGADVEAGPDSLQVRGGKPLVAGSVPSFDDHRIAMSAAVLGCLSTEPTSIVDGSCCSTSFPHFAQVMRAYGFDIDDEPFVRRSRRVLQTRGAGTLEVVDEELPAVAPGQVRLRVAVSLVSPGTERHYVQHWSRTETPLQLGYCVAGTVEELGEGARSVAVGDRVIAMGFQYAVHGTEVVVPQRLCLRVPAGLALERAVFANIAATALHAVHRGALEASDVVLVVGAGLVGQLVAQCARGRARKVIVVDSLARRLAGPRRAGLETLLATTQGERWQLAGSPSEAPSKIFLCLSGEASNVVTECVRLLRAGAGAALQPALIGVGRFRANVDFNVDMGNVDVRYSARCGSGYRDDDYVHGRSDYPPPPGQARVEDNLAECLQLIQSGALDVSAIPLADCTFDEAVERHATFDQASDEPAPVALRIHYRGVPSERLEPPKLPAGAGYSPFGFDPEESIPARFAQVAARFGQRVAVRTPTVTWTYAELNERANRIARWLRREHGDSLGRVALLFEHDAVMVAAVLGVLKAGAAYVPLDAAYPEERLRFMRADSGCKIVLTSARFAQLARTVAGEAACFDVDEASSESGAELDLAVAPDAPAYILYTSGSTGQPKGVLQLQRHLLHHMAVWTDRLGIAPTDRLSLQSAYSWDSAVQDTFGALLNGAALYPINIKELGIGGALDWFLQEGITVYHSTLPIFRALTRLAEERQVRLTDVRVLVLGGDLIYGADVDLFRRCFAASSFLVNAYGATESTTALLNAVRADSSRSFTVFPLGFPVERGDVFLVDQVGKRLEPGEGEGEIVIQCEYLAARYWGEVDQSRFAPDPTGGPRRLYRTGDVGRYLPSGELAYVGRRDFQVKIRGMRVELGEVESALKNLPEVEDAVVMAPELESRERELVAYVVPRPGAAFLADVARSGLARHVPDHALPARFVVLEQLPLTANGKIDRARLPNPEPERPALSTELIAPRSSYERSVAAIWREVLKLSVIGVNDNFFDLGGSSLKLAEVNGLLKQRLGQQLRMVDMYRAPTVAAIAHLLASGTQHSVRSTELAHARGALRAQLKRARASVQFID